MKPHRKPTTQFGTHLAHSRPSNPANGGAAQSILSSQTFDVHSGQVFKQVEVHVNKRQRSDWIGELKTPNLVKKRLPNAKGPRSLLDMAKGAVVRHMRSLSAHHLAGIPWEIAEQIWNEITEIRSESLHAWRTFATAYPDHFNGGWHRYLIEIKQPGLPLDDYYRGITSIDIKWFTCLRLAPRQVSVADVIRVANIKNLAVLDLSDGNATEASAVALDERVFKTWSELAVKGAFKHLRVLMLGWQEDISSWIFKYLDTFPSLCHVLITDSLKIHQRNRSDWEVEAAKYGWLARSAKQSAKSLRPLLDDKSFYLGAVSGCYYNSQGLFDQLATDKKPDVAGRLPVLECWLASPRPWTHVVEEYPGPRTVWFDNVKTKSAQVRSAHGPESRDQNKRSRGAETPTEEFLSPPSERRNAKRKAKGRSTTELLAEFGHA